MKSSVLVVLVLFCVSLFLLALWDPWSFSVERHGVSIAAAMEIQSIQVNRGEGNTSVVKNAEGQWQMVGEQIELADEVAIGQFVSTLQRIHGYRYNESEARFANAGATIVLQVQDGECTVIQIGEQRGGDAYRWIRWQQTQGSRTTSTDVLVDQYVIAELFSLAEHFQSQLVFPLGSLSPKTTSLRFLPEEVRIRADEVSWNAEGVELRFRANRGAVSALFQNLSGLSFLSRHTLSCDSKTPLLAMQDANGKTQTMYRCGTCPDAGMGVQIGGRRGCLDTSSWQKLTSWGTQPNRYVEQDFLPPMDSGAFSIACGDEVLQVVVAETDRERLAQWREALVQSTDGLVAQAQFTARCQIRAQGQTTELGVVDGQWLARGAGEQGFRKLRASVAEQVHIQPQMFSSLTLIEEEALFALAIRIEEGGKVWELLRGETLESWTSSDLQMPLAELLALANGVAEELATLRGQAFVSTKSSKGKRRKITIEFESPLGTEKHSYSVRLQQSGRGCHLSVNEGPWASLSPHACSRLLTPLP